MGRAERRKTERIKRIEEWKNKILVTREELNKMKEDLSYRASGYSTENLMMCFALTLSRKGYTHEDIIDNLQYINYLMDDILSGKHTMEEYSKELEDSTGIIIKCKEE